MVELTADISQVYHNLLCNSQIFSWPFQTINYPVSASGVPSEYYSEAGKSITNTRTDRYWYWHLVLLQRRCCLTAHTRQYLSATLLIKRFFQARQRQRERETLTLFLCFLHIRQNTKETWSKIGIRAERFLLFKTTYKISTWITQKCTHMELPI